MATRRLPNTITSVVRTLTTAREAWTKFPAARLIDPAHFAKLDAANPQSLLSKLQKEAGDVPNAIAAQAPTDASNKGLARLTLFASHFHQVYDFAIARSLYAAGTRAYYGREVSNATLPDLSTAAAVFTTAKAIVAGEAKRAQEQGSQYIAMTNPSAAEVAAVLTEVEAIHNQSEIAKAFTALQQNELSALYPEAQKLAVTICNTVEYHLENDDQYQHLDAPARPPPSATLGPRLYLRPRRNPRRRRPQRPQHNPHHTGNHEIGRAHV